MTENGTGKGVWQCETGPDGTLALRPLTRAEFDALTMKQLQEIGVLEWRN